MPSHDLPYMFKDHLVVDGHWRDNGRHYSRTLEAWLAKMDDRQETLIPLFKEVYGADAERWFQLWRIFFLASSELFAYRSGNEWWVSHYRLVSAAEASRSQTSTVLAGAGG